MLKIRNDHLVTHELFSFDKVRSRSCVSQWREKKKELAAFPPTACRIRRWWWEFTNCTDTIYLCYRRAIEYR